MSSPIHTLTVSPAIPTDVPALTTIYFASFQDLISLTCFPRTASMRLWWEANFLSDIQDPNSQVLKVTTNGDEIIAFGKWALVDDTTDGKEEEKEEEEKAIIWPEDGDGAFREEFFRILDSRRKAHMRGKRYYHLEQLGTHPSHQGHGAASMLLRWGLDCADQQGLEAFVEASPAGVGLYERFGWVVKEKIVVLHGAYTETLMIRPAKKV